MPEYPVHPSRLDACRYALDRCMEEKTIWVAYELGGKWYARPKTEMHLDRGECLTYDPDNPNQAFVEELEKRREGLEPYPVPPNMRIMFYNHQGNLLCQNCLKPKPPDECEWLNNENGDYPVCQDCFDVVLEQLQWALRRLDHANDYIDTQVGVYVDIRSDPAWRGAVIAAHLDPDADLQEGIHCEECGRFLPPGEEVKKMPMGETYCVRCAENLPEEVDSD